MFSQTTEYALRVVAYLASHCDDPKTSLEISFVTKIPPSYLAKVIHELNKAGLIRSQRGPNGGSVLARTPDQINIYDVVQAVNPIRRITSCPLGLKSHGVSLCPLHRRLDNALGLVEDAFRSSTLADLLAEPTSSTPLCESPADGPPAHPRLTTLSTPPRRKVAVRKR